MKIDSPTLYGAATAETIAGNGMFQKYSITAGETLTIPAGYGCMVLGPFENNGTLTVNGKLQVT